MPGTRTTTRRAATKSPRSATARRDAHAPPHVAMLAIAKGANFPAGRMLVASPLAIDAIVRRIPRGRLLTLPDLRAALAATHGADYTCPITTGIFLRIAAAAAEEERALGAPDATPWWRVVRESGQLVDTLPGGGATQRDRLASEGIVMASGRAKVLRVGGLAALRWRPE